MMNHHRQAITPPMGWNSWDCYGASVKESEVRANAAYMAEHMKPFGWQYVVVDIQWYEPGAYSSSYRPFVPLEMDNYSRLLPAVNRFPSAADGKGFKPLADYIHGLGLKFGIHIMRGIPRQAVHADTPILGTNVTARSIAETGAGSICPWNTDMYGVNPSKEGAQQYYNSLFDLYASWEVDFVKVDDIAASRLYGIRLQEIQLIRNAIDQCGRPMVLSLSPGPAPVEQAEELKANANMWRMTDDYWDLWPLLHDMFERCEKWEPHVGEGHWPDCDMLPLGHLGIRSVDGGGADRWTRFTRDEQVTMMSLWSIFRSPLMFGGELNDNDEWTLSLLTNEEVLAVHQRSRGAKQIYRDGERVVWAAHDKEDNLYVAIFNIGDVMDTITVTREQLNIDTEVRVTGRNLWNRNDLGEVAGQLSFELTPHASLLIKLTIYTD